MVFITGNSGINSAELECLDIALKLFSDEVNAWKLEKRIDQLAGKGPITKDLQKWAQKIRDEGNSALHEDTEPSRGSVEALWLFAELVLTHLFTLPHNVSENLPKT